MNRLQSRTVIPILFSAIFCYSCLSAIQQNPDMAAIKAVEFVRVAFLEQDFAKAHQLLSTQMQRNVSTEKLKDTIKQMHPSGPPPLIVAREYEPMSGQEAITIFLYGEKIDEKFYYRIVLEGTAPKGYRVSAIFRHPGTYISQRKKPLPVKRTTSD